MYSDPGHGFRDRQVLLHESESAITVGHCREPSGGPFANEDRQLFPLGLRIPKLDAIIPK